VQVYETEVAKRERGAYVRAAELLGVSDQHVANVVGRHEAKQPIRATDLARSCAISDPLAYIPCPGEAELNAERERIAKQQADEALLRQLLKVDDANDTALQNVPVERVEMPKPTPTAPIYQQPRFARSTYSLRANANTAVRFAFTWAVTLR
jgi:hypothetical protein